MGERHIVLARELTKVHETVSRGWVSELLSGELPDRGEYVVLVSNQIREDKVPASVISDEALRDEFWSMTKAGERSARDVVASLAERYGIPKQRIYKVTRS